MITTSSSIHGRDIGYPCSKLTIVIFTTPNRLISESCLHQDILTSLFSATGDS
ncbi:hypothetical protein TanjilG_20306 [Lupinus angustifolius]|uniref:Uncharacterized protein n=1 Tax=Lupinus angustifolius TaxID=3871 RepID=A0A1J7G5B6_LUPAN|nr:hypothetical protein TanjilG_20306 [Lupinus angustifolius]